MGLSTLDKLRQFLKEYTTPHHILPFSNDDEEQQHDGQGLNKDELIMHALSCVTVASDPNREILQQLDVFELLKFISLKDSIFPATCAELGNAVVVPADHIPSTDAVAAVVVPSTADVVTKVHVVMGIILQRAYYNTTNFKPSIDQLSVLQLVSVSSWARKVLISKVKFIPKSSPKDEGVFGTFWRPNLVKDTPKYVDSILDRLSEFATRREDATVLTKAAHFWMNAAPLIRKTISDKRSTMAQEMKHDVMIGLKHLKEKHSGQSCSDAEFFLKYPFYNARVLEGLKSLLQLDSGTTDSGTISKKTRSPKEMVALKTTDLDAYEAFGVLFLKHTIGKVSWRSYCRQSRISELFTMSDEAFAFLILDNNIHIWKAYFFSNGDNNSAMSAPGGGSATKVVETKYTKKSCRHKFKTGGWSHDGIRTYNELLEEVMNLRKMPDCKTMENVLMQRWREDHKEYLRITGKQDRHPYDEEVVRHGPMYIFEG